MLDQIIGQHIGEYIKNGSFGGLLLGVIYVAWQLFRTGSQSTAAKPAPRDHNHDETLGLIRNQQTSIEAMSRRLDGLSTRMEQMHAGLDRDVDAIKTDIREVLVYARSSSSRVVHHTDKTII